MTPLKTTLRGAIGIQAGLGRDEITIDLTETLPDDAVTIAIKGDNGMGKSTLLNLGLSPWLNPPQLPGSIYDHFAPEGERILEWSHGDERYRSTIQYRQTKKTQNTKAYLHVWRDADWHPVTLPDHTVSDSKTRTYSACLEHILGPQSIYYLSAFRAQNAPRLADYEDPKGLMRDLLHLDEPKELADQASLVRLELEREYRSIKEKAAALDEEKERLDAVEKSIPQIESAKELAQDNKQQATETHTRAKAEYDCAISEDLDREKVREERRKLEKRIADRKHRRNTDIRRLDDDLDRLVRLRRQIEQDATSRIRGIEAEIAAARDRIQRSDTLLARADEIRSANDDYPKLEQIASDLSGDEARWELAVESKRQAALELTGIGHTLDAVKKEGIALREKMEDQRRRASYVDQVPCHGKAPYDACPALRDAIQAAQDALETDAKRKDKLTDYRNVEKEQEAKELHLKGLGDPEADLRIVRGKQQKLREQIQKTRDIAALLPSLEQAEEDIQRDRQAIIEAEGRIGLARDTEATRLFECTKQEEEIKERVVNTQKAAEDELANLQSNLDALPPVDASDAVEHARQQLRNAEDGLNRSAQDLEDLIAQLAQAVAERESLVRKVDAGADITKRAAYLHKEIALWSLLSDGLKGVVNLSIEDAGPGIAEIANRLLQEAYGPRFTVRIITQRQNKTNEVLKEVFDISVIDSDTGLESSIVHKSGGENVWLDKALTDAVGLYHQEAAGMHFEAVMSDEAEDGLTTERKQQFYRMDRAALDMGGYRRKFFVSHNPDAWAMADAVIDLSEYREAA